MELDAIIRLLQESLYLIIVFGTFLVIAIKFGRQTVTNIILGLYLALLISIEFPFFDVVLGSSTGAGTESLVKLITFGLFTSIATYLFVRIMPREYNEGTFEGFGRKLLLALGGTVLVMIYSYHALPVTEFITPGSPINALFGSEQNFFYWLLVPIGILFLV